MKVAALNALAPTQSEPPFAITQAVVLVIFILIASFAQESPDVWSRVGALVSFSWRLPSSLCSVGRDGAKNVVPVSGVEKSSNRS